MSETLDQRLQRAVDAFWRTREAQQSKQVKAGRSDAGARGAVTGGAQMAEIEKLVVELLLEAGLDRIQIKTRMALEAGLDRTRRKKPAELDLPGYFRPGKRWDLLVIADQQLVAAIEFKSQVGSFGNNFNNRAEEAIGNAEDLWTAYREGRFGKPSSPAPFLGFFFLLQDCEKVHKPVKYSAPHFAVDPVFVGEGKGVSYAKRYEILLQRLLLERQYTAGCLTLSAKPSGKALASVVHPAVDLSFKRFADALHGHAVSIVRGRSG